MQIACVGALRRRRAHSIHFGGHPLIEVYQRIVGVG
jgi:hypothetical protein